jgi:hypothetical protein
MDSAMLSKLVDETMEDGYSPRGVNVVEGQYVKSINCFRFVIDKKTIDFPENWEFFNQINSNVLPLEKWILATFSSEQDPLFLLKCFANVYSKMEFFVQEERLFLELESIGNDRSF